MQRIDEYEIVRELGRGGMGVVYEARHAELDRPVALKLIHEQSATADAFARFSREAELLARVRHPNVLRVHELGRSSAGPYLVTELLEGQDLDALARAGVEPRRAAELVRDVAKGVAALHAHGVVHRDLKPENVFVRPDGSPVLLDFGIARDVGAEKLTQTGVVVGTPAYMSPEQAGEGSSDTLDARSDVYGVGAVLFFLLARRAPFDGTSLVAVLKRVMTEPPRWPSADVEGVPADLEAICQKAMAKEPSDRYPTAKALAADLSRFLADDPVDARPRPPVGRAIGVGALLLAVSLALGGGVVLATRPADPAPGTAAVDSGATTTAKRRTPEERKAANLAGQAKRELRTRLRLTDPAERHAALERWLHQYPHQPQVRDVREAARLAQLQFPIHVLPHHARLRKGGLSPLRRDVIAAFAGDHHVITVCGGDGRHLFVYWDLDAPQEPVWERAWTGDLRSLLVDPDGNWIVGAGANGVFRLDLAKGRDVAFENVKEAPQSNARSLAFVPDGRNLAVLGPDTIEILSWPEGARQRTLDPGDFSGDVVLALSTDGSLLAAGGGHLDRNYKETVDPGTARLVIWDLKAETVLHDADPGAKPTYLTFVPKTRTLLVGDVAGRLYRFDCDQPDAPPAILEGETQGAGNTDVFANPSHVGVVAGIACSVDGKTAYTVSRSGDGRGGGAAGELKVWSLETEAELRALPDQHYELGGCELSSDGTRLLTGSANGEALVHSAEAE